LEMSTIATDALASFTAVWSEARRVEALEREVAELRRRIAWHERRDSVCRCDIDACVVCEAALIHTSNDRHVGGAHMRCFECGDSMCFKHREHECECCRDECLACVPRCVANPDCQETECEGCDRRFLSSERYRDGKDLWGCVDCDFEDHCPQCIRGYGNDCPCTVLAATEVVFSPPAVQAGR